MILKAESFRKDHRVQKAKELLLEALLDHTKELNKVAPQNSEKTAHYHELIQAFAKARGAPLFYPYIGSGFGNGALVELLDGSVKYDMITGIGVHFFGHSNPQITESLFDAALQDTVMQGNLQQNGESLELMEMLINQSGLPHCFLTTSGVMANENAIKIAFQKNAPAERILAFNRCFAGRSLALSQVTDKPSFREGLPLNVPVDYIPYFDPDLPEESTAHACNELHKMIKRYPNQHAVMLFELVQGEGGFHKGSQPFFKALMEICRVHHIAVFSDEVQTFARTERLFAFQHFELEKYVDIVAIGKLTQVCATLFTEEYRPKPGLLSQTFTGSTSSIFASIALLKKLFEGNFYGPSGRMADIYRRFAKRFYEIQVEHPTLLKGPYGVGGMIAFTPLDGSPGKAKEVATALFDAGVISFIAGSDPTRIRFLPPAVVITDDDIDQVMQIVKTTLESYVPH